MGKIEEKVVEFNTLDARLKEIEQSLNLLEKQINELQSCQISLDELKNTKENTEVLCPISPGVFVKSKLLDNSNVIIDVGAKVLCKKNTEDAKKVIQKKLNKTLEVHDKLLNEINTIARQMNVIEKEIRGEELSA